MNELAQQTVWLNDLNNYMERLFTQREQRFEELETEHKLLLTQLSNLQYRMGIHKGAHERLDRLLMKLTEE